MAKSKNVDQLIASVVPTPGRRLDIQAEIGRGGMASVQGAVDRALQRRVAIKMLHPEHQHSEIDVRGFLREAQITAQLDHPNIVPVHELGVANRPYFMMKLVEGHTLKQLLDEARAGYGERTGPIQTASPIRHDDLVRLLEVFSKVLDAVAFAHSRGVVHCDLKPANVMVGDFGQVHLMDWGIARVLPIQPGDAAGRVHDNLPIADPDENTVIGTLAYMSPEQARGRHASVDIRSDVFSLGAMLFEILAGHPPYQGRTGVAVLMQAEECSAKLPDSLDIPRELRRIVARAMAAQPEDRYPKVEQMAFDLRRFIRGGGEFPRKSFAQGEWIIRQGDVGDAAYILVAGECEVLELVDGEQRVLGSLMPGEVFGETAILAATTRTASVVAKTPVVAMVVTREVVEDEVDSMKPWMGAFIRALAERAAERAGRK